MKRFGLSIVAIAALALSACSTAPEPGESQRQSERYPGVYAQTIDWGACTEDFGMTETMAEKLESRGAPTDTFRCAMVEAPLNWDTPASHQTIELAVVHVPSTGDSPRGTLFGNPGGPGGSGLEYTYGQTTREEFGEVLANYDLIGFDPRGIGKSSPLVCDDVSASKVLDIATCADAYPLAHSMGTSQVARDMDLLRELMGEDRLDYLGYSYGTVVGATYSTLFPERVGRMLLDSAIGSQWASLTGHFDQSSAIVKAIEFMLAECGVSYEVTACPIANESALRHTIQSFEEQPKFASDGTEVGGGMLWGHLLKALYGGTVPREIALDSFGRAIGGEQAAIDEIAEAMSGGGAEVGLSGQIVSCHSFPRDPDVLGLVERVEELGLPEMLGGPTITDEALMGFTDLSCFALPEAGDDLTSFRGSPDATILVVGITGDHATPYAQSVALVRELGNARLLTLEGEGHAAAYTGKSSCVTEAATAFLVEGTLPAEGTVCAKD